MHSSQQRQLSVWQPWEPLEEGTVWVSGVWKHCTTFRLPPFYQQNLSAGMVRG